MNKVKINDTIEINIDQIDYIEKLSDGTYTIYFGNRFINITEEEYNKIG